jgi:chromosome segregation ATPase
MDEKDRVFIESLFARQGEQFLKSLDDKLAATVEGLEQRLTGTFDDKLAATVEGLEQRLTGTFDDKLAATVEGLEQRLTEKFDSKLAATAERFEQALHQAVAELTERFERRLSETKAEFKQQVSSVHESFDHKISLLSEGHESLARRLDRLEEKMDRLDNKMDKMELRLSHQIEKVAHELAEHLADPEPHSRGYRIKEESPAFTSAVGIDLAATVDEMKDPEPDT